MLYDVVDARNIFKKVGRIRGKSLGEVIKCSPRSSLKLSKKCSNNIAIIEEITGSLYYLTDKDGIFIVGNRKD